MPTDTKRGAHGGRSSSAGGQFVCITYLCIGRALWAWNQEGQCKIALIRTQLVNFMQEHVNHGQFFLSFVASDQGFAVVLTISS